MANLGCNAYTSACCFYASRKAQEFQAFGEFSFSGLSDPLWRRRWGQVLSTIFNLWEFVELFKLPVEILKTLLRKS